jgi:hypothetical protein
VRRDVRNAKPYPAVLEALSRLCRESGATGWSPSYAMRPPGSSRCHALEPVDRDALQQELLGATRERMLREMAGRSRR